MQASEVSVFMMLKCTTIDANSMIEYIKDTSKRFQNLKSHKISLKDSLFQIDNERSHSSSFITYKGLSRPEGISVVHQSPYSPDLNLCDRYLFRASNRTSKMKTLTAQKLLVRPYSGAFGKYLKTRCWISLKSCVTTATS